MPSPCVKALLEEKGTLGGKGAQKVLQSILAPEKANLAVDKLEDEEDIPIFALAAMLGNELRYKEAMKGPEREAWVEATGGEIRTIQEMEMYSMVKPPPGANIIGCVWALKKK